MNQLTLTAFRFALLAGLLALSSNVAAQQGSIRLEHKAEQQETVTDENGVEQTRLVEAERVLPGDEVFFTVTYTNVGNEPAESVMITNPVPENMDYVDGSATGENAAVMFSIDGGENFGAPQDLAVAGTGGTQRPAAAEDYTHVRWVVASDVAPGASGTVKFTAVVE